MNLKKIVDPLIYPHVKLLNELGVETEFSCAGDGEARCPDCSIENANKNKIVIKKTHGEQPKDNHFLPFIITSDKLDNRCQIVLGLISILSPELFYCEEEKTLFGKLVNNQHTCPKDIADISVRHKGYKLIDIYNAEYNRKYIGVDRNMAMLLQYNCKMQKSLPLIRTLFLKHFMIILKHIKTSHLPLN